MLFRSNKVIFGFIINSIPSLHTSVSLAVTCIFFEIDEMQVFKDSEEVTSNGIISDGKACMSKRNGNSRRQTADWEGALLHEVLPSSRSIPPSC